MTYINFFLVKRPRILPKALYFESPSSPRAFDYGPGPGPGLSPSPKVGPRALEKTRAPGRAWTHH